MATREDRLQRARELHVQNPQWGRRRIAAQLRAEFGRSLRDSVIDSITRPYRIAASQGKAVPTQIPEIPRNRLAEVMAQVGFLDFEIRGVKGSPAKGLGEIPPDAQHPIFRQVINLMIEYRRREYDRYSYNMRTKGYGKNSIKILWRRRIESYYKKGEFPMIGGPSLTGGSFIDSNGKPSPWAVYRAIEEKLFGVRPKGGEGIGWGTYMPVGPKSPKKPQRTVDKLKLRDEIIKLQKEINQLSDRIATAKRINDKQTVARLDKERSRLLATRNKLSENL